MSLGGSTAQLGYPSFINIGEQATFGTITAGETGSSYFEFYTESLKQNREAIFIESINTTRDTKRYMQGNELVEGSLEADANVAEDGICFLIKQAMGGTVSSASQSATQVTHTFNLGDMESNNGSVSTSDVKSLGITVQKGPTSTSQFHFWGCRVNTLNITGEVGSPVKISFDVVGKTATNTAETHTVAFNSARPVHFTGVTISTGNTITAISQTSCQAFDFSINNNLVSDANSRSLGKRTVDVLPPTNREISCKLTMRFDTTTAYDSFLAATATAIQIAGASDDTCGSTAANTTYSMYIKLPNCYLENNPLPEISEKGIITQELEYRAIAPTTTLYSAQISVINATAGY